MNRLKKVQYNCHKATFLIEKRNMKRLTLVEKVELRIHLAGCSVCRLYEQQSHLISAMVHQLLHGSQQATAMDERDKEAIQDRIDQEIKNNL